MMTDSTQSQPESTTGGTDDTYELAGFNFQINIIQSSIFIVIKLFM